MKGWHKKAIVYQIYPRSFCDSNGDGIGDLRGIISKLDYMQSLGINTVWLNPIYKSPNDDGGYDISDFFSIQPEFGTMDDFDELLAGLHQRQIKLVMDLVLNHTSDEHPWFQESRKSKDNPYRNYYFWRPGKNGAEPNNWPSFFGNNAWELDKTTNEYYLHLYSRKQPDLNWEYAPLREEIKKIIRFWATKGVDGFRLDSISTISKRIDFPDTTFNDFGQTVKAFFSNGPKLKEFIAELSRDACKDLVTIGEGPGLEAEDALLYLDEKEGLSMIFHFDHMFIDHGPRGRFDPRPWSLSEFKKIFYEWDQALGYQGWGSIFLGNHDFPRMVSRWGDDQQYHEKSAKLLITLLLSMRGTPFIFQGDEIGMTNFVMKSIGDSKDIETINGWRTAQGRGWSEETFLEKANQAGRDNARTPVQWDAATNSGFTSGISWMPLNPNFDRINVETQDQNPDSVLNYFKEMVQLRKVNSLFTEGNYEPVEGDENLFLFTRGKGDEKILVALNFTSQEIDLPKRVGKLEKLIGNYPGNSDRMRPWEAVIFKTLP
ncbi:alpha-glucosidase [Cytophagales bacterium WSM2-2]|nr:alpha-glucosidase [Cytophagales bacterium WSM2-2]